MAVSLRKGVNMKKKTLVGTMKNQRQYYAMLLPGLVLTFIFCYGVSQ